MKIKNPQIRLVIGILLFVILLSQIALLELPVVYNVISIIALCFLAIAIGWVVEEIVEAKAPPKFTEERIAKGLAIWYEMAEKYPDYFEGYEDGNDLEICERAARFLTMCITHTKEEVEKIINQH